MIIKSSASLCENYESFSRLAHSSGEPIFITKDGEGDLVLMSIESYERQVLAKGNGPEIAVRSNTKPRNREKETAGMTEYLLGRVLRKMYDNASRGLQVASIHVFSIYFADVMEKGQLSKKEILKAADLPETYQTEISKGMNLARFVDPKKEIDQYISELLASFEEEGGKREEEKEEGR